MRVTVPSGIIHLAGMPAVGKTTVANALVKKLHKLGMPTEVLDGDDVRRTYFPELGFDQHAREENARRTFALARMMAKHGVTVVVALIAPYESSRSDARKLASAEGIPFFLTYLHAPQGERERRDPKGLYAKLARGEISGLTGVDAPYEIPSKPDMSLDTSTLTLEETVKEIVRGIIFAPVSTGDGGGI